MGVILSGIDRENTAEGMKGVASSSSSSDQKKRLDTDSALDVIYELTIV